MFERTGSGQQNRALFYGVAYTCYVEGGGGSDERSPDATFWKEIIGAFRPDLSIKCLPRGGKPILESLARDIIEKNIGKTLVAMDTDYDRLIGEIIVDPRVLYSYGYSWENDVFEFEMLVPLMLALTHRISIPQSAVDRMTMAYTKFATECRLPIRADMLAMSAKSSVLPRDAPGRFIKGDSGSGLPTVDKGEVVKLVSVVNKATKPRENASSSHIAPGLRYFVGHCLSHGIAMLLRAILRDVGVKKSLSSDHIRDVALLVTGRSIRASANSALWLHHQTQCTSIP